jgi:hypothetical protein
MKRFLVFGLFAILCSCDNETEDVLTSTACVSSIGPNDVKVGVPYQFNSCSQNAVSFHWHFDDLESTEENPIITFSTIGSVVGRLETIGSDGNTHTTSFAVPVSGQVGTIVSVATCEKPYGFLDFTVTQNGIFTALHYTPEGSDQGETVIQKRTIDGYQPLWTVELLNSLEFGWAITEMTAREDGSLVLLRNASSNGVKLSELLDMQDDGSVTLIKRFYDDTLNRSQLLKDVIQDGNTLVAAGTYRYDSLWVCRVDDSGNIIDEFRYGNANLKFEAETILKVDGGFIVAGPMSLRSSSNTIRYFVAKINDQLEEVWTSTFESLPTQHDMVAADVDVSGNTYLLLRYTTSANLGGSKLVRLNSSGVENLSLVLFPDVLNSYMADLYIVDNSLIIVDYGHVTRLTTDGNIEWKRFFDAVYYTVQPLPDSRMLISGVDQGETSCSGNTLLQPIFLKMTTEGEVVEE